MNDFLPKAVAIAVLGELGLALGLAQVAYVPNDERPIKLLGGRTARSSRFIATTLRPPVPPPPPRVVMPPAPKVFPPTPSVRAPRRRVAKATPTPAAAPASASAAPAPGSAPGSGTGAACAATDSCRPSSSSGTGNESAPALTAKPAPAPIPSSVLAEISDRIDRIARRSYPELARRRGVEGTVRVCFFVGPLGTALSPVVDRSSDDEDLDEAARAAVIAAAPLIAPRKSRLCKAIEYRLK